MGPPALMLCLIITAFSVSYIESTTGIFVHGRSTIWHAPPDGVEYGWQVLHEGPGQALGKRRARFVSGA
jgi:hypothetical protein